MPKFKYGLIVLLGFLLPTFAFAATTKITNVRINSQSDITHIVFELNTATHYQWRLDNNLQQLTLKFTDTKLTAILPKNTLSATAIKDYHFSTTDNSVLTLWFQLKNQVTPKIYYLAGAGTSTARLVMDLKSLPEENEKIASETPKVSMPKGLSRPVIVVIDPGHGGKDPGACGPGGGREKEVVLAISKTLRQQLNQQPGFRAELTRDNDVFIPLRQRLTIARKDKADLFIAIHADAAFNNQDATGASVFALSERGATSEMARWLAEKENNSELLYGVTANKDQMLRSVLLDLSQTHTIAVSLEMGREILHKISNVSKLHNERVEQAAFVVLKSPDIPSLLIETGYITNPRQEQKLKDSTYQRQLAAAIVQGVMVYFAQHPLTRAFST